jgi:hypothetical protein
VPARFTPITAPRRAARFTPPRNPAGGPASAQHSLFGLFFDFLRFNPNITGGQ